MDNQSAAAQLPLVVVGALVAVVLVFFIVVQSGGLLAWAIERAIDDGKVILGMTKDDVISSWGRAYQPEEHSIRIKDVNQLVALSWTYESPHRIVHFSSDGMVIWVVK